MSTIDIVGHFGTTFSYATVGARVAGALKEAGRLGSVFNLDPQWHTCWQSLLDHKPAEAARHVLLFTAPNHYIDIYAEQYGRERSALFMSPNTDALATEHARTAYKFGLLLCPSSWCERVAHEGVEKVRALCPVTQNGDVAVSPGVVALPLGADERLDEARYDRLSRISELGPAHHVRVLHFSTDQSWPGRKGTEPLLVAWSMLSEMERKRATLRIHAPPALARDATHMIRDLGIDESVELVHGAERGSTTGLVAEFDRADLVVAPSRCEGFGIMLMGALAAGVPLACTAQTGPFDYLQHLDGWLGVPTAEWGELACEQGQAPIVAPQVLVNTLRAALRPAVLAAMATQMATKESYRGWLWPDVVPLWVERLVEWMEDV